MIDFFKEAYQDEKGIWRWKSNNRVPFDDMLEKNDIDEKTRHECTVARIAETTAALVEYVSDKRGFTDEERFEMQAAFGKGATVVNVIAGEITKL